MKLILTSAFFKWGPMNVGFIGGEISRLPHRYTDVIQAVQPLQGHLVPKISTELVGIFDFLHD